MTPREYRARTDDEWRGVEVRATRDLVNGNMEIPRGTVLTIERKYQGFWLRRAACECCGVRMRITKVDPSGVEVVE